MAFLIALIFSHGQNRDRRSLQVAEAANPQLSQLSSLVRTSRVLHGHEARGLQIQGRPRPLVELKGSAQVRLLHGQVGDDIFQGDCLNTPNRYTKKP